MEKLITEQLIFIVSDLGKSLKWKILRSKLLVEVVFTRDGKSVLTK